MLYVFYWARIVPSITSSYSTMFWGYVSMISMVLCIDSKAGSTSDCSKKSTVYTFLFVFGILKKSLSKTISATSFVFARSKIVMTACKRVTLYAVQKQDSMGF